MTAITFDPNAVLQVLDERGWTKGKYEVGNDGPVCLHGAIRLCTPVPGDAALIEQVAHRNGWGIDWNDYMTRNSRGGTQAGADIDVPSLHYAIEAKNQKRWVVPAWWRQTVAQSVTDGGTPLLVIKQPGTADVAESLAVLRLGDLIGWSSDDT